MNDSEIAVEMAQENAEHSVDALLFRINEAQTLAKQNEAERNMWRAKYSFVLAGLKDARADIEFYGLDDFDSTTEETLDRIDKVLFDCGERI